MNARPDYRTILKDAKDKCIGLRLSRYLEEKMNIHDYNLYKLKECKDGLFATLSEKIKKTQDKIKEVLKKFRRAFLPRALWHLKEVFAEALEQDISGAITQIFKDMDSPSAQCCQDVPKCAKEFEILFENELAIAELETYKWLHDHSPPASGKETGPIVNFMPLENYKELVTNLVLALALAAFAAATTGVRFATGALQQFYLQINVNVKQMVQGTHLDPNINALLASKDIIAKMQGFITALARDAKKADETSVG